MGKSGLFKPYLKKMAQVIAWFYPGKIGGGFTYWPEGPLAQPKRLPAPMWNNGVLVQNEMMYHRAEANGPLDMRHPQGLAFNSLFGADPDVADGWQITTDGKLIQRIPAMETRFLVHWSADVYEDFAELKKTMDHSDDLTHEKVFEIFIQDLRARPEVRTAVRSIARRRFRQSLDPDVRRRHAADLSAGSAWSAPGAGGMSGWLIESPSCAP